MQRGDLCLVTGVSGYLASWIAKYLLEQGFAVRGTVRSLNDKERLTTLEGILPGVTFAAADLRQEAGWAAVVEGVKWVFHVASPQAVASETDRTGGAVKGTEYLMAAALASPSVEKIVLTSSEAAIAYGTSKRRFTEDDWTDLSGDAGRLDYFKSKTLAEKLAWDMVNDPRRNPRGVPMATICPSFILGPSLVPWGRYSLEQLKSVIEGRPPFSIDMMGHNVDVRDCAMMHIALMQNPATNGHRHFSFSSTNKMVELNRTIRALYSDRGFRPSLLVIPTWVLGLMRPFVPDIGSLYPKLGHENLYVTKWPDAYTYRYTDLRQSIRDAVDSMIAHGWITPQRA